MSSMTFETVVQQGDTKNTTGLHIPEEIISALGAGKKPPVKVTLNGYTYRSTVAVMGGIYMISVSAEIREKSGVKGGDTVAVTLELDQEPRTVDIPDDLAAALEQKSGARAAFDAANYSTRKEFVRQVTDAKSQETRDRRIANIVAKLGS